jgi:hypothetical protein
VIGVLPEGCSSGCVISGNVRGSVQAMQTKSFQRMMSFWLSSKRFTSISPERAMLSQNASGAEQPQPLVHVLELHVPLCVWLKRPSAKVTSP